MNKLSKLNFKAILTLLTVLMFSLVMFFTVSCGNTNDTSESTSESDSSSSESTSESDSQTIYNGDFEWTSITDSTVDPIGTSTIRWTRRTDSTLSSAPTSTVNSGVIDTAESAYEKLADKYKPTDEEGNTINPGTPALEANDDTQVNEAGTKILMIRNSYNGIKEGQGTAQYFTSAATVTLDYGKCAKISVWVRTDNLKSAQANAHGAYIKIANTVGSSIDPLLIKNIDTKGKWVNYVVYLKPSEMAQTRYNVVLGLGMGGLNNPEEYCEGFAYFDNVEYTVISPDDYSEATNDIDPISLYQDGKNVLDKESEGYNPALFIVNENGYEYDGERVLAMNFAKEETDLELNGEGYYNAVNPNTAGNAVEEYAAGFTAEQMEITNGVVVPENSIYMDFQNKTIGSSYTYETGKLTLAGGSYAKYSFYAKVSAVASSTNANVTIHEYPDGANDFDSTTGTFADFTTEGLTNEYYNDYIRYTFYLVNNYDNEAIFTIRFSFGPTSLTTSSDAKDLPVGYAIFTDFTVCELTKEEYTAADISNDTHAVKVALLSDHTADKTVSDDENEEDYEEIEESYFFSVNSTAYDDLSNKAVDFDQSEYYPFAGENGKTTFGVVNSYYRNNYAYGEGVKDALQDLDAKAYIVNGNRHVQPLMIYNEESNYAGIRTSIVTIPAGNAYLFTAKIRVTDGAKAYVYLMDVSEMKENLSANKYTVNDKNYEMVAVVDSATEVSKVDGYATVKFLVVTNANDDALKLRLEIWNGARDGSDNTTGAVLIGSVNNGTSYTFTSFESFEEENYPVTFANVETYKQAKIYHYYDEKSDENLVKDDDGNAVYTVGEEFTVVAVSDTKLVQFYDYSPIDQYVIDERPVEEGEEETTSESEEESESAISSDPYGSNIWLQVSSIVIAAILIVVLVVIIVRKALEKRGKKKAKTQNYYAGYNKDNRYSPKSKDGIEAPDDDGEYNYDNTDGE